MPSHRILIAEDERTARLSLARLLEADGFEVSVAADGTEAFDLLSSKEFDLALIDVRMPRMDGLTLLSRIGDSGRGRPVIVMTAYGDSSTAIEAMKRGAFDYILKPIDMNLLLGLIHSALETRRVANQTEIQSGGEAFEGLIGSSPSMQRVYKLIGQVARTQATVLVRGESGTGKELVVNAIHQHSFRCRGPLVKVNCASIPESLLEAELFGHERGAFTGAVARRVGRFEEAHGGTLFLDEIGELAMPLQAKLLRAVQERRIERLGSNTPVPVDIRLITATAKDLESAVTNGAFREDLYYRLNVVSICLPPLRERKQDIPALVHRFVQRAAAPVSLTPEALSVLCSFDWPGNVRELENVVERCAVLARNGVITAQDIHLGPSFDRGSWADQAPLDSGLKSGMAELERSMIVRALKEARGSKTRAAELLKIHRRLLYEKIREHGL